MSINKLKGLLVALALCFAPAVMAVTVDAADFDGTVNVAVGGASDNFGGTIDASGWDYLWVNIAGTGSSTATSAIFTGGNAMQLFTYTDNLNGTYDLNWLASAIALADLPNEGKVFTLTAFLAAGTYVLGLSGAAGSTYAGAISAVPLPGAALLFGSALFGAGMIGRKKLGARKIEAVAA